MAITDIFGGGADKVKRANKALDDIFDYDKQGWEDSKERLNADYDWMVEGIDYRYSNDRTMADFQDVTNFQDFQNKLAIRDRQIGMDQMSFDKGMGLYDMQVGFNNEARNLGIVGAHNEFNDAIKGMNFQADRIRLDGQKAIFDSQAANNARDLTYRQGLMNSAVTSANADVNFAAQQMATQLGRTQQDSQFLGQQRSARLGAIEAQNKYNEERDTAIFKNQDAVIKALEAQGMSMARGTAGNSAGRLANVSMAALGRGQAVLQNQLLAGNQRMNIELSKLQNNLATQRRTKDLNKINLSQQLETAERKLKINKTQAAGMKSQAQKQYKDKGQELINNLESLKSTTALNEEILTANAASSFADFENQIGEVLNKARGAQIKALANKPLPPVDPVMPPVPLKTPVPEYQYPRPPTDFDYGPRPIRGQGPAPYNPAGDYIDLALTAISVATGLPVKPNMNRNNNPAGDLGSGSGVPGFDLGSMGNSGGGATGSVGGFGGGGFGSDFYD